MRRGLIAGVILAAAVLAALWVWRTPTAALVRLKLALDRHDLISVMAAVDADALADEALGALLEEPADGTDRIRLVLRGDGAWLPAISSARDYLRLRVERDVERLVEDPEQMLRVSWAELRRALDTLRRSGAIAHILFERDEGSQYVVRLRWGNGRWRIVSVERDGAGVLLTGAPVLASPACDCGAVAAPPASPATDPPGHDERFVPAQPLPPAEPVLFPPPRPRHRRVRQPAFARRLTGGHWAVQVSSTTDAAEAELEREWLAHRGQAAFVEPADVKGTTWQRVLIGRFETRAEAEASLARLRDLEAGVP